MSAFGHLKSFGCAKAIKDDNCASELYRLWIGELKVFSALCSVGRFRFPTVGLAKIFV